MFNKKKRLQKAFAVIEQYIEEDTPTQFKSRAKIFLNLAKDFTGVVR